MQQIYTNDDMIKRLHKYHYQILSSDLEQRAKGYRMTLRMFESSLNSEQLCTLEQSAQYLCGLGEWTDADAYVFHLLNPLTQKYQIQINYL